MGEDELRGGVGAVMAEGEVLSVEADEDHREDEDHDQADAKEDDDAEKVGLVGWKLFDFHGRLDARGGGLGTHFNFALGGWCNLTDDGCSCTRRR